MAEYTINLEAELDLGDIYWWGVEQFGKGQARRYALQLLARFERIAEAPYQYAAVDHIREGYRHSPHGSHTIYYRVKNGEAEIMRVLGVQDPQKQL